MRCVICGEPFSELSFGNPTEPCACGAMVTKAEMREANPERGAQLLRMKLEWQKPAIGERELLKAMLDDLEEPMPRKRARA